MFPFPVMWYSKRQAPQPLFWSLAERKNSQSRPKLQFYLRLKTSLSFPAQACVIWNQQRGMGKCQFLHSFFLFFHLWPTGSSHGKGGFKERRTKSDHCCEIWVSCRWPPSWRASKSSSLREAHLWVLWESLAEASEWYKGLFGLLQLPKVVYPAMHYFWGPCTLTDHPLGQAPLSRSQGQRYSVYKAHTVFPTMYNLPNGRPLRGAAIPDGPLSSGFSWRKAVTHPCVHIHPHPRRHPSGSP